MRLVGSCVQLEPVDKIIPIVERGEAIRTFVFNISGPLREVPG